MTLSAMVSLLMISVEPAPTPCVPMWTWYLLRRTTLSSQAHGAVREDRPGVVEEELASCRDVVGMGHDDDVVREVVGGNRGEVDCLTGSAEYCFSELYTSCSSV